MTPRQDSIRSDLRAADTRWTLNDSDIPLLERHNHQTSTNNTPKRKPVPLTTSIRASWTEGVAFHQDSSATHTYTQISNVPVNIVPSEPVALASPFFEAQPSHARTGTVWLPRSLRGPYIISFLILTLILFVAIVALLIRSTKSSGLCHDNGSLILSFGWRFVPTLFAVLYALWCTILLQDVKRTEPYARLAIASVAGADPRWTILQEPVSWWTVLRNGFSRRRNHGTWSWSLISSTLCMVISSFVLLPLSSSLLLSVDVVLDRSITYSQFAVSGSNLAFDSDDQSIQRSRTISNILQNVTTSAWITDDYTVLPIWPSSQESALLGATLTNRSETWHGESLILKTEMSCQPMRLVSNKWLDVTVDPESNVTTAVGSVDIAGDNGCAFGLILPLHSTIVTNGGASWARKGEFFMMSDLGRYRTFTAADSSDPRIRFNHSASCPADEFLIMMTSWTQLDTEGGVIGQTQILDWNPNFRISGQACSTQYFTSKVQMAIENAAGVAKLVFDQEEYLRNKQHMNDNFAHANTFQTLFLTSKWSSHLVRPTTGFDQWPQAGGPASLLMAAYNFSISDAMDDSAMISKANRIKQRYIGEALISALSYSGTTQSANLKGFVTSVQPRIAMAKAVAIALGVLLVLEFCLVIILFRSTRISRRQLNVSSDPAKAALVAKMIANASFRRDLAHNNVQLLQMERNFSGKRLWTSTDHLHVHGEGTNFKADISTDDKLDHISKLKWRPTILRRWTILVLILSLLVLTALIVVLYAISKGVGLYQRAFVYETRLVILDNLSVVAPYSIVPTLVAVGISLWWGAIEAEFKSLQPYIAMVRGPVSFNCGMLLSYQSSHHLFAALRAGMRGHWLLALICIGGVLAQIFTIAMSSLWKPEFHQKVTLVNLQRDLEIRATPLMTEARVSTGSGSGDTASSIVLSDLYGQLKTNWLYSAMIQLTLNGTQPSWSYDGWSFVPVDTSSIRSQLPVESGESITQWQRASVTLTTPALRGRLECNPYGKVADLSRQSFLQDFTNKTLWDVTANPNFPTSGYQLDRSMNTTVLPPSSNGSLVASEAIRNISTSFFANPALLSCCENKTSRGTGDAVIGYWSLQYDFGPQVASVFQSTRTSNFTIKWLHGQPVEGFQKTDMPSTTYMVWPKLPRMAALDCSPIIEKANTQVTIDPATDRVISFKLLEKPRVDATAWNDALVLHTPWNATIYGDFSGNVTSSYGPLFIRALLKAADIGFLAGVGSAWMDDWGFEPVDDISFTFRRAGINMDYMSYSMYAQAGYDGTLFLDEAKLYDFANRTFSTFFQHYVSSNHGPSSLKTGTWAFQKIGEKLPSDLPPIYNLEYYTVPPGVVLSDSPDQHTNRTVQVSISIPVKVLRMSPVAVWLCVCILLWLAVTAIWITIIEKRHLGKLRRGVGTIADVAVLVAGSDALLSYIQREGIQNPTTADLKTELGWFRDRDGRERWGIELAGTAHGVQWLNGHRDAK